MTGDSVVDLGFHWSPNAVRQDTECPAKTFWGRVFGGSGLEPTGQVFELEFGTVIHTHAMAEGSAEVRGVEAGKDIARLCNDLMIQEPLRTEWPIFAEALVYAFRQFVWDPLLQDYEVVKIEGDLVAGQVFVWRDVCYRLPWHTRPDLILKHKATGFRYYWDLKTTGMDPQRFCKLWERSVQLHMGCWAWNQVHPDEPVEAAVIQGLHKGSMYKGSLRGPLVTLYRSRAVAAVTHANFSAEFKKGYERGLISEFPGGITAWVDALPRETLAEIFPCTPMITPDDGLIHRVLNRTRDRAGDILAFERDVKGQVELLEAGAPMDALLPMQDVVDHYFPRNFPDACENILTGRKCVFYEACWNPVTAKDPVASGLYQLKQEETDHGVE